MICFTRRWEVPRDVVDLQIVRALLSKGIEESACELEYDYQVMSPLYTRTHDVTSLDLFADSKAVFTIA